MYMKAVSTSRADLLLIKSRFRVADDIAVNRTSNVGRLS